MSKRVHGGQEQRGEVASWPGTGGMREGEDADGRGPHVSERRQREGKPVKGTNLRRNSIPKNVPEALGLNGQGEKQLPKGRGGLVWVGRARSVGPEFPWKIQWKIDFRISMEFEIWQEFGKFYKEILEELGHGDFPKFF
jgi:hypothetical protein